MVLMVVWLVTLWVKLVQCLLMKLSITVKTRLQMFCMRIIMFYLVDQVIMYMP